MELLSYFVIHGLLIKGCFGHLNPNYVVVSLFREFGWYGLELRSWQPQHQQYLNQVNMPFLCDYSNLQESNEAKASV